MIYQLYRLLYNQCFFVNAQDLRGYFMPYRYNPITIAITIHVIMLCLYAVMLLLRDRL